MFLSNGCSIGSSLDDFLAYRQASLDKPGTIQYYKTFLGPWCKVDLPPDNDGRRAKLAEHLQRYERGATQRSAWRAIREYESWRAKRAGVYPWVADIKFHFPPAPKYEPLSPAEFERVMQVLRDQARERMDKWFTRHRDFTLFSLLYYTGARLNAIRLLKPADCSLSRRTIQIKTKGGVQAPIVVPDPALERLEIWLACLKKSSGFVFPSTAGQTILGKPINAFHLSHLLPKLAKLAGIDRRVWVHGLRHSCITEMLERGVPIEVVQAQALHKDIRITQGYATITIKRIRREIGKIWV